MFMAENGRLPASELRAIAGGRLREDAAAAWNAMRDEIGRKENVWIRPTGSMSSYRTYDQQVYFWNLYLSGRGNLAARPGTSNHGWGLAVDVATPEMARCINKYGAKYGYQKAWSDAQSEWWHFKYRPGIYKPAPRDPVIRKGSVLRDDIRRLQKLLRAVGYRSVIVNGRYDILSRIAVRKFQRKHNLTADGVVGPRTWAALRKV